MFYDNNNVILNKHKITNEIYNFKICYYDDVFKLHKNNVIAGIVFDNNYVMEGNLIIKWYNKNPYIPFILNSEIIFLFDEYCADWLEIKFNNCLLRLNKADNINSDFTENLLKSNNGELFINITTIDDKSSLQHQVRHVYTKNNEENYNNLNLEIKRNF